VYKNFSEYKAFKTSFANEGIYGGRLLGIRSKDFVTFYDWDDFNVVRRIDLGSNLKHVLWSEDGAKVVLGLEDNFYLLDFHSDMLEQCMMTGTLTPEDAEDGFEEAFTFTEEFAEQINSGQWISQNCLVFINNRGNINYLIGNRIVKLGSADKKQHILGYDGKQSRLYLIDKSLNIYAHRLLL
jgi:coatomer subunit beta'